MFAEAKQAPEAPPVFRLRWLAPAMVTLFLMCLMINQRSGQVITITGRQSTMETAALSNQSAAAWLPGSFTREQNGLPAETFEWTNGGGWTSSKGSLRGPRGTN